MLVHVDTDHIRGQVYVVHIAGSAHPEEHVAMPQKTFLAAAALAAVLAGCGGTRAAPSAEPLPPPEVVPVRTVLVERGPVARPIRAPGTVAAKDERNLAFKVGGLVARVAVQEGDHLRRGQVLATLDTTELAAGVRQASEAFAKAERDRERARSLGAQEVVPRATVEDAETGAAVAAATLEAARFNLRNATLVAADEGFVYRRLAEPGEVVAPGQPVLRVSGVGRGFVVRANLPERDALDVAPGDVATVTLDARPDAPVPGRVTEVARSASRGTGTYLVEIALDARRAPPGLLAGLTAKVEIARSVPAAASVPLAAIQDGDGPSGAVFVVDGARARRVPVRIAFLSADRAVLAAGPDGFDQVVTDGASRLTDGAPVRLVP
jgi:RND family efflux transporter MFP subunit